MKKVKFDIANYSKELDKNTHNFFPPEPSQKNIKHFFIIPKMAIGGCATILTIMSMPAGYMNSRNSLTEKNS